jgi:hypothetical protein
MAAPTETLLRRRPLSVLRSFLDSEAAGGLVLMAAAALALVVANSPLAPAYFGALHAHIGPLSVSHWINDGLMAVFFLLVGWRSSASCSTASSPPGPAARCPASRRPAAWRCRR